MFKFETTVLNNEGQPLPGATVSVFAAGTSILVQLYEDDQTTLKTNPLTADSTGFVQCKAANGKYDYTVSTLASGLVRRVNGVIFDDPTEAGSASIALTMPGEFTVTGSPGQSLGVTKKAQVANTGYFGPAAGSADAPTFRAMVSEDMPLATQAARGATQYATLADRASRSSSRVLTVADSDWVAVATYTVSTAVASIPFNNILNGTYPEYIVEAHDMRFSSSTAHNFSFQIGVTSSGTTTYLNASTYYTYVLSPDTSATNGATAQVISQRAQTSAIMNGGGGILTAGTNDFGFTATVRLPYYNNSSARWKGGAYQADYGVTAASHINTGGGWAYLTPTNYDSIQFFPSTGNIISGKITIYGRNK